MIKRQLMKFTAPWCGACKLLDKTLDSVLPDFNDIRLDVIDVEIEAATAKDYHITTLLRSFLKGEAQ